MATGAHGHSGVPLQSFMCFTARSTHADGYHTSGFFFQLIDHVFIAHAIRLVQSGKCEIDLGQKAKLGEDVEQEKIFVEGATNSIDEYQSSNH